MVMIYEWPHVFELLDSPLPYIWKTYFGDSIKAMSLVKWVCLLGLLNCNLRLFLIFFYIYVRPLNGKIFGTGFAFL